MVLIGTVLHCKLLNTHATSNIYTRTEMAFPRKCIDALLKPFNSFLEISYTMLRVEKTGCDSPCKKFHA